MSKTFLTEAEVGQLTGVSTGAAGKTLLQRRVEALEIMRVPHYVNPLGKIKVPRASIEHGIRVPEAKPTGRGIDLSKVR